MGVLPWTYRSEGKWPSRYTGGQSNPHKRLASRKIGRSEVLRSLRRYLRTQSQRHHATDRLEERGVESGSTRRSCLKGRERAIVSHMNFGTFSKTTLGEPLRVGVERIWAFSERIDTILNWTELSWLIEVWQVVCRELVISSWRMRVLWKTFGTVSKATLGKPLRDGVECIIMGLSERVDTILNWTELG